MAGGYVLGNPEVRARATVVVRPQHGAVGVLQPPARINPTTGVHVQRARRVHDDSEVIHVARLQHPFRFRFRFDTCRRGPVVAVIAATGLHRNGECERIGVADGIP